MALHGIQTRRPASPKKADTKAFAQNSRDWSSGKPAPAKPSKYEKLYGGSK